MYGQPYLTFLFLLVPLLFDVPIVLLYKFVEFKFFDHFWLCISNTLYFQIKISFTFYFFKGNLLMNQFLSSSCCAASTDLPDPLSPPVSIVNCSR